MFHHTKTASLYGIVAFATAWILSNPACAQPPKFTVTDLGTLPNGTYSYAAGINNRGEVTGYADRDGVTHAFLFSSGQMIDLGPSTTAGRSVNDLEAVTGSSSNGSGFIYLNGTLSTVGSFGGPTDPLGINSSGQVTGGAYTTPSRSTERAFLYDNGNMTDLGTLGGVDAEARGINATTQITGSARTSGNVYHAFVWASGTMTDLGTLGGTHSGGNSINNAGQITGYSDTSGVNNPHAFLFSAGVMNDLGTLGGTGSYGYGINSSGDVVGTSSRAGGGSETNHAFLYFENVMYDVNALVPNAGVADILVSTVGNPINDVCQIAAYGHIGSTGPHALLLTPVVKLLTVSKLASGHIYLTGQGVPTRAVSVEVSSDLTTPFTSVATLTADSTGAFQWEDSHASEFPARFYRAALSSPTPTPRAFKTHILRARRNTTAAAKKTANGARLPVGRRE